MLAILAAYQLQRSLLLLQLSKVLSQLPNYARLLAAAPGTIVARAKFEYR